jgi:hypothetical protein
MDKVKCTVARRTKRTRRVGLFTRERWEHWSVVCRYLDAQPQRCIAVPFPDDPPISYRLLSNMAQFILVRHRNSDCRWQVSPRWRTILDRLAQGLPSREQPAATPETLEGTPFKVDFGVDTLYVNVLITLKEDEDDEDLSLPFSLLMPLRRSKSAPRGNTIP